jgi:hypothetical protein
MLEGRPALPGFRAALFADAASAWPFHAPGDSAPEPLRRAAEIIGRRLAADGLLFTTAQALMALDHGQAAQPAGEMMQVLRVAGLPTDLLAYFSRPQAPAGGAEGVVADLCAGIRSKESDEALRRRCSAYRFQFAPSLRGFRAATDSGEWRPGLYRMQVAAGDYWKARDDGGSLDLVRQVLLHAEVGDCLLSIEDKHVEPFRRRAAEWPLQRPLRITLLPGPLAVSQWAQDNGRPGWVEEGGSLRVATIVPRYASRGEDGSTFVPGDTFLMEAVAAAGHRVVQSPLLFQGGNLLIVREPGDGRRVMLIGEAEIWRNVALGLTARQVLEAFRVEFGVESCELVPAIAYHADYEVSFRVHGERVLAFVNDSDAAGRAVLAAGISALETGGIIDTATAASARTSLAEGRLREVIALIGGPVLRTSPRPGRFTESLARCFSLGEADSGVGNLQRFLLAMDMLAASILKPDEAPEDAHARAYLRSFERREADREKLWKLLSAKGWKVVPVPSLSDTDKSINYLNGLHEPGRYLMPAYGGLYAPLDRQAAEAFARELGPSVRVVPILCSESQRRVGAVRCSVASYPVVGGP